MQRRINVERIGKAEAPARLLDLAMLHVFVAHDGKSESTIAGHANQKSPVRFSLQQVGSLVTVYVGHEPRGLVIVGKIFERVVDGNVARRY